ncbi:MAG: ABC transporter substrate-binding protein [Firmicutes bacterium]|nr:ABC transporter substrate-binding protein [Bacillota bacterium]
MRVFCACLLAAFAVLLAGCGSSETEGSVPEIDGLSYESTTEPEYADGFEIYRYEGGYSVIDVKGDSMYLILPEGEAAPENVPEGMTVIGQKPENIYLAATSSMALIDSIGGLDQVKMTELKESGWTIESVKEAMKSGRMVYAGKYSEPDYELILKEECDLAVESTMIYHVPQVKEMLEKLGIPVLVDRSSYESHPLGRTEWVKVYGAVTGREAEAEKFFAEQKEKIKDLEDKETSSEGSLKVAFFYVTSSGKVVVRSSDDYIPKMIEMAGGSYCFEGLYEESGKSSVSMTMESFFAGAVDADIMIYNTNIDHSVKSLEDLKDKSQVFSDFKAVQEGRCYTCGSSFYQRTDRMADMIMDLNGVFTGNEDDLKFITKLQ